MHQPIDAMSCSSYILYMTLLAISGAAVPSTESLLACTDNTHVFRDIKRIASRKVLELDPSGRKVIEVGGHSKTVGALNWCCETCQGVCCPWRTARLTHSCIGWKADLSALETVYER